ncbi:hypothetical protein [Alcaligenes endophyticus]|uniref:Uncharacterized protein n=1 Tax=Alcaligenes endophyticus TaxID=1929088 RepID=A0ABT8EIY5_9BURK|nr:hypothetical protein [Alcaligenes endophyticus]MCX5592527.1 hypothetical protein [Alcaligenes endophyticus]MDN4121253.1 hypothetical protein [Alcaligenes endophyticus]
MSKERKIIFEKHPVTSERKAELREQGYTIIDAVYAPQDYIHPDAVVAKKAPSQAKPKAEPKAEAVTEPKPEGEAGA